MERNEVGVILATLSAVYPNYKISEHTLDVWHMLLKDLTLKAATEALTQVLRTERDFPPTPGHIIAQAERDKPNIFLEMARKESEKFDLENQGKICPPEKKLLN